MNEPTEKTNESDALGLSVSLTEGIECFFDVGEHIIHVWGSAWSGRETVSVDGQVVSDTRNLTRLSACHRFEVDGIAYHAIFKTESILRGHYAVELYRGEQLIDSDSGCYPAFKSPLLAGPKRLLLWLVGLFAAGFVFGILGAWMGGGGV